MTRQIFVFGSNLAGAHGGGSARAAVERHGAIMGKGVGPQGDSYAIPTLDADYQKLALYDIAAHVGDFIEYVKLNPEWSFNIVAIGCGIAGFTPSQIAPMFAGAPANCTLPPEFLNYCHLQQERQHENCRQSHDKAIAALREEMGGG